MAAAKTLSSWMQHRRQRSGRNFCCADLATVLCQRRYGPYSSLAQLPGLLIIALETEDAMASEPRCSPSTSRPGARGLELDGSPRRHIRFDHLATWTRHGYSSGRQNNIKLLDGEPCRISPAASQEGVQQTRGGGKSGKLVPGGSCRMNDPLLYSPIGRPLDLFHHSYWLPTCPALICCYCAFSSMGSREPQMIPTSCRRECTAE